MSSIFWKYQEFLNEIEKYKIRGMIIIMSKFYFSILKNIESQFKINLSQINQYLNSSNVDGYQKYKNVTHLCIGDI